jgi:hypothetical protein
MSATTTTATGIILSTMMKFPKMSGCNGIHT